MPAPLVSATSSSILLNLWKDLSNLMDRRERYKGSFTDVTRAWFHDASAGFRSQRRSEEARPATRRLRHDRLRAVGKLLCRSRQARRARLRHGADTRAPSGVRRRW